MPVSRRCRRLEEVQTRLTPPSPPRKPGTDDSYVEALVSELEILAHARLTLLERNLRESIERALPVALRAREQERGLNTLGADLTLVQAHWQAEKIDEAISILERGLSFAAERGLVQLFVDEGLELARILYGARTLGVEQPFIGKLLTAFPLDQQSAAAAETQPHSLEPLSAREVEVLTLLSQGLSSRTQAIAKVRKLEILPE
jgi:LuxR family maltose regulon positive regulatory protein